MTLEEIRHALEHALLHNGEMHRELYEYELEEHVDYWKASMWRDRDEFLFVVDVRTAESLRMLTSFGPLALAVAICWFARAMSPKAMSS